MIIPFPSPAPTVLDLFSGCGGLSLGFRRAGFNVVGGIEMSQEAAASHAQNFHPSGPEAIRTAHTRARDICTLDPRAYLQEIGHLGAIDVIVGGPPCQAYARVGRAKLRHLMSDPDAYTLDERGSLFLHYLRFVRALTPRALLMENVPDILNYGGRNVAEEVSETLEELGYQVRYTLLNAANYGVPQLRERFFLLAVRSSAATLDANPFPKPSHHISHLPKGYRGTRGVATRLGRLIQERRHEPSRIREHFVPIGVWPTHGLPNAVSAKQALSDLPRIRDHLNGRLKRGARRFDTLARYRADIEPSAFALEMRNWPGFESHDGVFDHVIRRLPRDYPLFRAMKPGDEYPQAHRLARDRFRAELEKIAAPGEQITEEDPRYISLLREIVPPYDPSKFPNKWRKMEADSPARTLMAHLGKDSYSHIHYDSKEARTISVREAARLQSFPDGFRFAGTMNPAFKQIGNAVPPKMAFALAKSILAIIEPSMKSSPSPRRHSA